MPQDVVSDVLPDVSSDGVVGDAAVLKSTGNSNDDSGTRASPSNGRGENGGRSGPHSSTALQDLFLNGLRRENIDVVVYFCDGTQERGVVRAFDTFTLLLENRGSGKAQLVYKHAVARIFPVRTPSLALDRAANKRES